jgi:hypothetical protein
MYVCSLHHWGPFPAGDVGTWIAVMTWIVIGSIVAAFAAAYFASEWLVRRRSGTLGPTDLPPYDEPALGSDKGQAGDS